MRKQGLVMVVIVVVLLGAGGFLVLKNHDKKNENAGGVMSSSDMHSNDSQASTGSTADSTTTIKIQDFAFSPSTITVKKGTTLTWVNEDSVAHTVTGDNGGPDSDLLSKGQSYSYTFNEAGSFAYHCKPHPHMMATVIVTD